MSDIHLVKGKELRDRWREIAKIADSDSYANAILSQIARGDRPVKNRYQRFVASAYHANFGMPCTHGPHPVNGWRLGDYAQIMASFQVPLKRKRRLVTDKAVYDIILEVPESKDEAMSFQEILWMIIERYDLDFTMRKDLTFVIVKADQR